MRNDYSSYLDKLARDSIEIKGQANDIIFGLAQISNKLDTIIALLQVGISQRPPKE